MLNVLFVMYMHPYIFSILHIGGFLCCLIIQGSILSNGDSKFAFSINSWILDKRLGLFLLDSKMCSLKCRSFVIPENIGLHIPSVLCLHSFIGMLISPLTMMGVYNFLNL